jgi:vancomycin permeability regulator SanA
MSSTITYDRKIFTTDKILYVQQDVHQDRRLYSMVCLSGGAKVFVDHMDNSTFSRFDDLMDDPITYDRKIFTKDKILYVQQDVHQDRRLYSMVCLSGGVKVFVDHMDNSTFSRFDDLMDDPITYDRKIFTKDKILHVQQDVHQDRRLYSMVCLSGGVKVFVDHMDNSTFSRFDD